jgi:hypothetical protein
VTASRPTTKPAGSLSASPTVEPSLPAVSPTPPSATPPSPTPPSPTPPSTTPPSPTPAPSPTLPVDPSLDAALARCPTAREIDFIDSRLVMLFIDDPTAPDLVCRARDGSADLTLLEERGYQAVLTLRRIKFDEPLPWTDRGLFNWFVHATRGVRFEYSEFSHFSLAEEVIVVRSNPEMSWEKDEYWVSRDPEHLYGLSGLVGLLVHEARHGDGYFHTCAYSEEAAAYGDDQTMEEMGAWAVNSLFFEWIAEHSNVEYMTPIDAPADLYRESARETADYLRQNRICSNYEGE